MKPLTEFKSEYTRLLTSHMDKEQKHTAKEIRTARKQAKQLSLAIRLMEQGITEDTLKNERTGIKKKIQILDNRFSPPRDTAEGAVILLRKSYEKENGYADMKRQLTLIRFMINY